MCRERGLKIDRNLGYFLATAAIITLLKSSLVNDTSLLVHCNQYVLKCTNADVFKMSHTSNYELFSDIIHHWSCTTVNRQQKKFVDLNVGCKLSLKLSLSPTRWSKFNIAQLAAIRWRATLAHCFASYYSFLFVLWRISPSLVIYLKCSLQQEKNSKSGPHKAGYWRSGDQASRLQSRKKPCYRDKQFREKFRFMESSWKICRRPMLYIEKYAHCCFWNNSTHFIIVRLKANYGQIHSWYNQFDKGYIRRLPVISLAEPCTAR